MEDPQELVVFFSYDNAERPRQLAERLVADLKLPYLALGVDALTGGCELRLYYHPETLKDVKAYLEKRKILHDITTL